ncbi:MAG: hypothetical protein GOMPHAMPRED_003115 [Gomphillus americanus]|uniref:NACHT domain-containing protein n=1 Tax=Gomphillus americanus TaxID=1940652 RepID=A0A8H3EGM1_9LECA|nr:MAG: hypothetical protein GOMPHAMPRED_003115 [Gomphillus americanus]
MPSNVNDYTVGWICAIRTEYVVACELLDEEYKRADEIPRVDTTRDHNIYTFGRIHEHNVVIACLPDGRYGLTSAAIVAERMRSSFPALRFGLMVGIAGGAPSQKNDIRLGDIVVSSPTPRHGGVIQYDFGKAIQNHDFDETGHLGPPPEILLSALSKIKTEHERWGHKVPGTINGWLKKNDRLRAKYSKPDVKLDKLYKASYVHLQEGTCDCQINNRDSNKKELELIADDRKERDSKECLHIHYGLVASANRLMKDATARDAIAQKHNVLCFEMEAAGLMNNFPCLVIRGICDYSDTHKNDKWQGYAAAAAAAYAKELLEIIPGGDIEPTQSIEKLPSTNDAIRQADAAIHEYYTLAGRLKIQRLSGETLPLEKCYINLALKDLSDEKQRKNDRPSFSLKVRLRLEASDIGEQVALSELFTLRKLSNGNSVKPRRIFIQGRAGIGKTTLCKAIVHTFLQHGFEDKLFERLLWIPLRSLQERDTKYGWSELLEDVFSLSSQVPDWDNLVMAMSKQLSYPEFRHKTLFLLDGLDEASREWKENSKIFKFLQTLISTAPNIILTSRPQAGGLKIGEFDFELEVVGFNRDQINTYIDHCVTDKQTNSSMKDTIAAKPLLQGLLCIPVQLDAFCCTWSSETTDEQNQPSSTVRQNSQIDRAVNLSTMTTLYQEITSELCRKDLARIRNDGTSRTLHMVDVLPFLEKELSFLEKLAFQGLVNDVIIFNHKHREKIGRHFKASRIELPDSCILEKLSFLRTSSDQLHHSRSDYHFLHLTYQEFFAAKHFVRHWQTDDDLQCLKLLSSGTREKESISPIKFLRKEKYNPRYNIFWRFVTGLIQLETDEEFQESELCFGNAERNGVVAFFEHLNDEPVDLLGVVHRRLLMCCLSEVAWSNAPDVQSLRKKEENVLRKWTIEEYTRTEIITLGQETEFPEHVLSSLLESEQYLPREAALKALYHWPMVNRRTLSVVNDLMENTLFSEERLLAAGLISKNSETRSQEMLSAAITALIQGLKNKTNDIQTFDTVVLAYRSSLPQEAIVPLITLLEDNDARSSAADALRHYKSPLSQEAIATLIALLEDKDARSSAADVLRDCKSPLSQEAIATLITLLEDKDARSSAAGEAIAALVAQLEDEDYNVRSSAAGALGKQSSSLPQEAIAALVAQLEDEDSSVRSSAAAAWGNQSYLPQEAIAALITLLEDEESYIRYSAAGALGKQSSSLPQEAIAALVAQLEDTNYRVRSSAAEALENQLSSLSQEAITTIIFVLANGGGSYDLLHKLDVYSSIKRLDDRTWHGLWSYWSNECRHRELCCYQLEGVLYIWSDGILHAICTDPKRTEELLQIVLSTKTQQSKTQQA